MTTTCAQTPTARMMTSYKLLEFNLIQKSVTFELLLINNVIQQQRDNKKVLPFTLHCIYKQKVNHYTVVDGLSRIVE